MLGLLSQLQSLLQGDSLPSEYLGRAQVVVNELAMTGCLVLLDEQNLYVFRGLRQEFRVMASSLITNGVPVTITRFLTFSWRSSSYVEMTFWRRVIRIWL